MFTANTRETTTGGGRRQPAFVEAAEDRRLRAGCEHWAYLYVETEARKSTSSWPLVRVEGRVWAALLGQNLANLLNLVNPVSVPECLFWNNPLTFFGKFS